MLASDSKGCLYVLIAVTAVAVAVAVGLLF